MCFQIFEQFVKTRIKEEYKEKKSKLLLAKEEFRKLLEESKVSPRYGEKYTRNGGGGGARGAPPWFKAGCPLHPKCPSCSGPAPCQAPREAGLNAYTRPLGLGCSVAVTPPELQVQTWKERKP